MSESNGTSSPTEVVARNMAGLISDVVTLAELQGKLVKVELQHWTRSAVTPVVLLLVAIVIALGCVPVLLLGLAYLLVESAGLSLPLSLLIAAGVGLAIAGMACAVGWIRWRKLQYHSNTFQCSQEEFNRNVNWIKQVLKHHSNPSGGGCGSTIQHGQHPRNSRV